MLKTIRNNGRTKSQLLIGSYVGQGAIYSVVVKQQDPTGAVTMASYIPMVTYACNLNKSGDCVETELFIGGFMAVFLVSYILLNLFTSLSTAGNLEYWIRSFNYGMTFVSGVLLLPVILLSFTKLLNILTCAFVGGYLSVLLVDTFLNTGLKYIIVNSFRHAVIDGYLNVIMSSPFLTVGRYM
ncbi:hypothetical protein KUTeg_023743 [Tegillarca granosa]|uniref:TM7S3/TM198-like domain-containing protein n=1 Tax=Tegillarca granosa TaxID=220873 RepID=A0ABQ9E8N8_TEGGR|nr:hypothetical protein KUTeg_023743 [Tegillarca granosa]